MPFTYDHPKADVTVDAVVFGYNPADDELRVLLVRRDAEPFKGRWALPGGYIHPEREESLLAGTYQMLLDKTGVAPSYLEQLATFGDPGRDPRGRVISIAYMALVRPQPFFRRSPTPRTGSDLPTGDDVVWFRVSDLTEFRTVSGLGGLGHLPLAFDHYTILTTALDRLRSKIRWQPVGIDLLSTEFTLGQLERLYEVILGRGIEKRNFQRRVMKSGLLIETGRTQSGVGHRPGTLYRFDKNRYNELKNKGIDFKV